MTSLAPGQLYEQLLGKMKAMEAPRDKQSLLLDYGSCRGYAQALRECHALSAEAFRDMLENLAMLYQQACRVLTVDPPV